MRLLILSQDFAPNHGGIAVFLYQLCRQLGVSGHEVDVLTCWEGAYPSSGKDLPYRVYRYTTRRRLSSVVPIMRTMRLQHKNRYDAVLLGHFATTHALGAILVTMVYGVPYAILSHGNDLVYSLGTRLDRMVAGWLLRCTSKMFANSHFTATRIRKMGYPGVLEVLHPGVNVAAFHPDANTRPIRRRYGLNGRRVIVSVSRLVPKKNISGVLRALPEVVTQVPELLYLVVGDGPQRRDLENLRDRLGLQGNVKFVGHVDHAELPLVYCASEFMVMPSCEVDGDHETFGIALIESGACGRPVIAGRTAGVPDAVVDGVTGFLVDPGDQKELSSRMLEFLNDPEKGREMGEAARRRAVERFDWKEVARRLVRCMAPARNT